LVVGPVSSWFDAKRRGARERFFLQLHVGMQIDLGGLDRFVSKPESNHGTVNPILEKVHCSGMSKRVWAYVLPLEGLAFFGGDGDVFLHQAFNGIAAELSASDACKKRIVWPAMAFAHPGFQHLYGFWT